MSWIGLNLKDGDRFVATRRAVLPQRKTGYEPVDPHVTVHSGIRAVDDEGVAEAVAATNLLVGEEVLVRGLSFYPSAEDPRVVMFSVDIDGLEAVRGEIEDALAERPRTRIEHDPVPAHVTLCKTGDPDDESWDETGSILSRFAAERLRGGFGGWETEVSGVFFES